MTEAEFDAAVSRKNLPLNAASRAEIYAAMGKLEAMIACVTRPKPRETEPALIFVPGRPA